MVLRKGGVYDFYDDVVQVDVSKVENRSIIDIGVEVFTPCQFDEYISDGIFGINGMAFLT